MTMIITLKPVVILIEEDYNLIPRSLQQHNSKSRNDNHCHEYSVMIIIIIN